MKPTPPNPNVSPPMPNFRVVVKGESGDFAKIYDEKIVASDFQAAIQQATTWLMSNALGKRPHHAWVTSLTPVAQRESELFVFKSDGYGNAIPHRAGSGSAWPA